MNYIVYETATGVIIRTGTCSADDLSLQAGTGESAIEGTAKTDGTEKVNTATGSVVLNGTASCAVTDAPLSPFDSPDYFWDGYKYVLSGKAEIRKGGDPAVWQIAGWGMGIVYHAAIDTDNPDIPPETGWLDQYNNPVSLNCAYSVDPGEGYPPSTPPADAALGTFLAEITSVGTDHFVCDIIKSDGSVFAEDVSVRPRKHFGSNSLAESVDPAYLAGDSLVVYCKVTGGTSAWYCTDTFKDVT